MLFHWVIGRMWNLHLLVLLPATGDGAEEQAGEDDDECGIASLISLFAGKAPKAKATKQVKPQASSPAKPTVPKRASTATSVPPAKKTKGAGAAARTAPTAAAGKENIAENANAANAADDVEQQGEAEAAAAVEAQPIRKRGRKQPDQMETEDKKALEELENELEENHFLEPTSPDDFTFYIQGPESSFKAAYQVLQQNQATSAPTR